MGLKEGIALGEAKRQRLSAEETAKIKMEIAKMATEMVEKKQTLDMEATRLKMEVDGFKLQKDKADHFGALMEGFKRDKVKTRIQQMALGGASMPDERTRLVMMRHEGVPIDAQQLAVAKFIQEGLEPKEPATPVSAVGKILHDMNKLPQDHPMRGIYKRALEKAVSVTGQKIEIGPDGTVTVTQGPGAMESPLSKPTQTEIEKDTLGLSTQLGDLTALKESYSRDYLTYGGRLKGWSLRQQSKAGMKLGKEGKQFVGGMRQFIEGVEQVFNQYRKEITGAQAAMKEIAMLRNSILNKEMSPDEFEYSYNRYISQIQRQFRLKTKFLREGITNEKELGKRIDQAYLNSEDTDDGDLNMRGDEIAIELLAKGVSKDQIPQAVATQLKNEGYR